MEMNCILALPNFLLLALKIPPLQHPWQASGLQKYVSKAIGEYFVHGKSCLLDSVDRQESVGVEQFEP